MPASACGLNGSLLDNINKEFMILLIIAIRENVNNGQPNKYF